MQNKCNPFTITGPPQGLQVTRAIGRGPCFEFYTARHLLRAFGWRVLTLTFGMASLLHLDM